MDSDTNASAEALRLAARRAIEAHDELSAQWRSSQSASICLQSAEDVELLKQLVLRRIDPVNAFAALCRIDKSGAIAVLLRRYIGEGVDPDRKFGGFGSELWIMLDDLCEEHGEDALRDLVHHPQFNRSALRDPRVVEAFADSLDIEVGKFPDWLKENDSLEIRNKSDGKNDTYQSR
jgi:hypothetical protein